MDEPCKNGWTHQHVVWRGLTMCWRGNLWGYPVHWKAVGVSAVVYAAKWTIQHSITMRYFVRILRPFVLVINLLLQWVDVWPTDRRREVDGTARDIRRWVAAAWQLVRRTWREHCDCPGGTPSLWTATETTRHCQVTVTDADAESAVVVMRQTDDWRCQSLTPRVAPVGCYTSNDQPVITLPAIAL